MIELNRKVLGIAVFLMAAAMLATPVMAIGPFNALDVGKNKNLTPRGPAVVNHRGGEGRGVIFWMMGASGEHWVRWEFQDAASQAKGLMNNAIIAEYPGGGMIPYIMSLAANENKWIYLSGDGATYPGQYTSPYGTHGMHWYFRFATTMVATGGDVAAAIAAANAEAAEHPQGVFWKSNNIPGSLP